MFLARITGSLVATQKVESMVGQKLLIVEPLRVNEKDQSDLQPTGRTFVAVDTVGSGGTEHRFQHRFIIKVYGEPKQSRV